MKYEMGFSKGKLAIELDPMQVIAELVPNKIEVSLTGLNEVNRALQQPIGTGRLGELVTPGDKVAIITSDITRPMPSKLVLPVILEELNQSGIPDKDIIVVFGMGIHRHHTKEERMSLVGEDIFRRVKCLDSDPADCVVLGTTRNGTPVEIFRPVAEADKRICLGVIEYHYFAGYSGGAKAIMPGVSTRSAIQANHRNMVLEQAHAGNITNNPVRQDIDEVASFVSLDFILNVVLDQKKQIVKAVAGHYITAHREGCRFLDSLYKVKVPTKADIVITSAGGFPKDLNLYQAQKALDNAKHAVKDGGIIILVASCKEGLGEDVFEEWMLSATRPEELIERIRCKFALGGHKAAAIAMVMQRAEVYLVSELPDELAHSLFMKPFSGLQDAISSAYDKLGKEAKVILMPLGGSTLPFVS